MIGGWSRAGSAVSLLQQQQHQRDVLQRLTKTVSTAAAGSAEIEKSAAAAGSAITQRDAAKVRFIAKQDLLQQLTPDAGTIDDPSSTLKGMVAGYQDESGNVVDQQNFY